MWVECTSIYLCTNQQCESTTEKTFAGCYKMQRRDTTSSNGSKAISSVDIVGNATSTT